MWCVKNEGGTPNCLAALFSSENPALHSAPSGGATAADEGGDRPERLVRLGWSLAAFMAEWLDFSHDSQNSLNRFK